MSDLVLVKLGGSVITDKNRPFVAHERVVRRLGREIIRAASDAPGLRLIIGHGSGSFGHQVAHEYRTHEGIVNDDSWHGFAETARAAARLNRLVTDWLFEEGLPVVSFQPSATARCRDRRLVRLDTEPIQRAQQAGLIPIVYGDVALDEQQGFTIISTEQIFDYLATRLPATRIVLAGIVDGVFDADPVRYPLAARFERITPRSWPHVRTALGGSHAIDVTGGMLSKVQAMVELVTTRPELSVTITSGAIPGRLCEVLSGQPAAGTTICADTGS